VVPHTLLTRLAAGVLLASLVVAATGLGLELMEFGLSVEATTARLEADVRGRVTARARQVEALGNRLASIGPLIEQAVSSRDRLPGLFARLDELTQAAVARGASATIYVPAGVPGAYRVIAWSEGPSDELAPDRLAAGTSGLFVAQGTAGIRLVSTRPIESDGRRVGVAVSETLLAATTETGAVGGAAVLETAYGPVTAIPPYVGGGELAQRDPSTAFVVEDDSGATLVEVGFTPSNLEQQRQQFRRRTLAAATLPLVVGLLLLTGPVLTRRFKPGPLAGWRSSAAAGGMVLVALVVMLALLRLVDAPPAWTLLGVGLGAAAFTILFPVMWWWYSDRRSFRSGRRLRFVAEQLAAGLTVAFALVWLCRFVESRMIQEGLGRHSSPLFGVEAATIAGYGGLFLVQMAVVWTAASLFAGLAARWRLTWRRPSLTALLLWLAPTSAVLAYPGVAGALPAVSLAAAIAAAVLFAHWGTTARHRYRHTSQATRLVMVFAAMVLPTLLLSQLFLFYGERQTVTRIVEQYARDIADHPLDLRDRLRQAQEEIDALPALADFILSAEAEANGVTVEGAFSVWRRTNLSTSRVTSEVELFGMRPSDGRLELVSRFGLNVPEFEYGEGEDTLEGGDCEWRVFDELKRFGAIDRRVSHAQRGVCDAGGGVVGAIVVHVLPDYQSLPFIASANTYYALLSPGGTTGLEERDLAVVVYGWGLNPQFTSSRVAWPIHQDIFDRLYASREPFWLTLPAEDRLYRVFFRSDRAGIYAVGYPLPRWLEISADLAETVALVAGLFIVVLLCAAAYGPFSRRHNAPLRALFHEIRTSFYRKLFLFFVLAAVGPVFLLTLAFGAYMSSMLRADVESEATAVVTVARQVFEQLSAAVQHPDEPQRAPTDDQMVLIRQMIDQDVNLYRGPDLLATSQRDLFTSGLLPRRTPAAVYRAVALERLPSHVAEDRLGPLEYMVAAAPVPLLRQDTVLTVPLALRQREIEEQLEQLNRGVLVGAVLVVLFAAGLGASVAGRISDPVARLSRATRQIAAGRLDVRITADTADELRRLVDDFNTMTARLVAQRAELARSQQLKAWAEMARQVAHEIKNPLTPVQLAAEHLERVHDDRGRPLGVTFDQCLSTIYRQVRTLRTIASEFANFAGTPTPRLTDEDLAGVVDEVVGAYRLSPTVDLDVRLPADLPRVRIDRTLVARALTNLVENAMQAMPGGGALRVSARRADGMVELTLTDTGVGMESAAAERAFEPYFSTKTAGSGLGLANARRNVELCGGTVALASEPGRGTTVTIRLPGAGAPGEPAAG